MNRPALRSVLERAPRGVLPGSVVATLRSPAAAAFFSSTSSQLVLKQVPARRERMAAAASEVGALGSGGAAAAVPVADARSLGARRPAVAATSTTESGYSDSGSGSGSSSLTSSNAITAGSNGGMSNSKIINVRSLPRRPANGGASFPGPTGVWSGFSGARLQGAGGGGAGRFAAGRGRGGAAGGGGGGGQGRRRRRPAKRRGGKGAEDEEGGKRGQQEPNTLTVKEQAWMETREVGAATAYQPSLTLESLVGYGPAVASSSSGSTAASFGNTSAVLRAMRVLGGGMPFCAELPNPTAAHDRLLRGETVFFDSADERAAAEAALLSKRLVKQLTKASKDAKDAKDLKNEPLRAIAPVRAATKTAILETTVRGVYEEAIPGGQTAGSGSGAVFEALRRYRSKDATWSAAAGRIVEDKVRSLLPSAQAAGAKSGQQARRA